LRVDKGQFPGEAELQFIVDAVCPRNPGGYCLVPEILFKDPVRPAGTPISLICTHVHTEVRSSHGGKIIVQRWGLGLASGWVVKYGMALGNTQNQVYLDPSDTMDGGGPEAFTCLTHVSLLRDCWP